MPNVHRCTVRRDQTSVMVDLFVGDASSTVGAGLTGLVFNSAGLAAYYHRDGDAAATAITLVTMTVGTWASGGFKEVSAANMPGFYQVGLPDALFAGGYSRVSVMLKGAVDMVPVLLTIDILPVGEETATVVADGGNTASTFRTSRTSATDDDAKDCLITFVTGALVGQVKKCSAYDGTSKFVTVASVFTITPSDGDRFVVINL